MTAVLKSSLGTSLAEGIINEVVSRTSKYYYFLGKDISWNPGSSTEIPELPIDDYAYELSTRAEIITFKQIKAADVSYVVNRYDWTLNTIYDMYDDSYTINNLSYTGASKLEDSKYYVLTDNFNVYKCISNNNNSPSTVKPSGIDNNQFITSDGYVWKFMFVVPIAFINKFLQPQYIPVTTSLRNRFYSNGAITSFSINNMGSGYVQASTTLVVQGDGYLAQNPYIITGSTLTASGYGYPSAPAIIISSPVANISPVQAIATSTLGAGGILSAVTITNIGFGYNQNALITIAPPITGALAFSNSTLYTLNQKVNYLDNYYNVSTAGTSGVIAPTNITGTFSSGSVVFTYIASQAYAYILSSKTEASLTPVIINGQLTNITINDGGIGYSNISVSVVGIGTSATVTCDTSVGSLDTAQTNVELLATSGSIDYIKVVSSGSLYSTAAVTITGDGTGATATAVITSGMITAINITNRGLNYTKANVAITGDGVGVNVRAIMSPKGGHGKNAVDELHARTLMFFSTLANDANQGIKILNDYRQLGIIKNPRTFDNSVFFNGTIGSACYLFNFNTIIDTALFQPDMQLTVGAKKFIIVSVSGSSLLIQSINNSVPIVGDQLINPNNNSITLASFVVPTIDKYSGYLLYIDNRNAFTTTAQQAVNLRTTIRF